MQLSLEKLPVSERMSLIEELWNSIISDSQSLKDIKNVSATQSQKQLIELLDNYLSDYAKNKFYNRYEIQQIMGSKGIRIFCHFTPIDNLESILRNGLYPRDYIDEHLPNVVCPDGTRAEGMRNGVCLSISFPNYRMFFNKREELKDIKEWAVITLKAQNVVSNYDCAFFPTNSAFGVYRDVPLNNFMDSKAFNSLFDEEVETRKGIVTRDEVLGDKYPTDAQAEVIVFDHIPPELIGYCYLQSDESLRYFKNKFKQFKFSDSINNLVFSKRDYFLKNRRGSVKD